MSRPLLAVIALLAVACSASADPTTSSTTTCEDPPANEMTGASELEMTVSPNPAEPRQVVRLAVARANLGGDAVVGVDAEWQCWDGAAWVTTHVVYRGLGDNAGQTIAVNSEFQIRIPSIGLALDDSYPIVIPLVAPGVYRIADDVLAENASIPVFTIVDVVTEG